MDIYSIRMAISPYGAAVLANVVRAIDDASITQLALSEKAAIPRTTLLRRLAGESPFTADEVYAIATALDIPVERLTEGVAA